VCAGGRRTGGGRRFPRPREGALVARGLLVEGLLRRTSRARRRARLQPARNPGAADHRGGLRASGSRGAWAMSREALIASAVEAAHAGGEILLANWRRLPSGSIAEKQKN